MITFVAQGKIYEMKKWILKAIVQKSISFFPNKHQLNYWFQKNITKGVQLSEIYFEDKLIHFKHHHKYFATYGTGIQGQVFLELGTGWYPVIPICLFLEGAKQIYTVDISPLTTKDNVLLVIRRLLSARKEGKLDEYFTGIPERWKQLEAIQHQDFQDLDHLFEALNIQYLVQDARQLDLGEGTVDGILSNNTFEHVYPEILEGLLKRFQFLLKNGGIMSHFIDMSDHFAHLDPSITIYNFLRYSERQWEWIDNTVQPQNRWRMPHYRRLYDKLGIPILKEENRPGSLTDLGKVPVHQDFKDMTPEEMAISHSYVVSNKVD